MRPSTGEGDRLSVMRRWWLIRDNGDDPQAQWWTDNEATKRLAEREGSEVVEYVPADAHRGAVDRAEKAEAELAKIEPILVAADRVLEAYEAMLDGRKLGRLPDFEGR